MTKVQNLPPNAPKSPNSHILTWGPFGALRGPSGALGGNIVSLKPLPIKSARKNETFELSMGNTKIFLGVWRVVSMCPTLLTTICHVSTSPYIFPRSGGPVYVTS